MKMPLFPARMDSKGRSGIYPGSFDPFTNGHLDIVERSLSLFDTVFVAIATNSSKSSLFTLQERKNLIAEVFAGNPRVQVVSFENLLVDFAKESGAVSIIRGLRAVTDFDYEYAMFQVNRDMEPSVETVFLLSSQRYSFLSSTIIKEIARLGRDVSEYTPRSISQALARKFGHVA